MATSCLLGLLLVLLLARPRRCGLRCDYTDPSLETLQCKSFGRKTNNILPERTAPDDEDTTSTDLFRMFDWTRIKSVVLKDTNMREIHSDLFVNASSLTSLDISGNAKVHLDNSSYNHLRKLQGLSLSLIATQTISISKLTNLKILSIDHDTWKYLMNGVFNEADKVYKTHFWMFYMAGMKNIFKDIESTRIESLSLLHQLLDFTELEITPKIKLLNIIQSIVKLGDRCFANAKGLRFLTISRSRLTELPQDVFGGAEIAYLDLSRNSLLPAALISLTSGMKNVNVSYNTITDVDYTEVGLPSSLEIFDLSHNTLSRLDELTFSSTPDLFSLNLSNNRLRAVHKGLFANLRKLTFLDLSNNLMSHLSHSRFEDLVALDTLNLSGNRFRTLENNLFRRNANLRILSLSNNELEHLRTSSFYYAVLRNLQEIDVSKNRLRRLPIDFLFLNSLTTFSLSYNRISSFHPLQLNDTIAVTYLNMRGNPWKCGCLDTIMLLKMETVIWYRSNLKVAFTDGRHPSCYSGLEKNYNNDCDDAPLSDEDYDRWEEAVRFSGQY